MSNITPRNPILNWTERPPYSDIKPGHVSSAVETMLAECETLLLEVEQEQAQSWNAVMPLVERIEDKLQRGWGLISHLHSVRNSPELREVYAENQPKIVNFYNRYKQSRPLFETLQALKNGPEWDAYEEAQRRIIEATLKDAELSGVGLEGDEKERFNEISQRLAKQQTQFGNNVLDATKAYTLTLTDPAETDGLSDRLKAQAAEAALLRGHEAATADDGPWVITLDQPSYRPFMQHSTRRDLREKLFRAYVTRAADGENDNHPLIDEILALRQEMAELLGYDTFAEMSMTKKMAASVEAVDTLLDELRTASQTAAENDIAELRAIAAEHDAPEADDLRPWDFAFWAERMREQRYDLHDEELRPYFSLNRVLDGLFSLVTRLFGVNVVAADGEAPVWHEDVRYFRVHDAETHEQLAAFYLDPYSRPSEKRGGAWMDVLVQRSRVMAKVGDPIRLPAAYMCCNQSPPSGGKPSLMTFSEVTTMFHEFGHAIHHMLTTVDYGMASGVANVEWDAIELPSQFMENWCYHRPTLRGMAKHYETGEPLPDEIMDRLIDARTFRAGYQMLRQLNFGRFDMELHARYNPDTESVDDTHQRIAHETLAHDPIEEDKYYCAFAHIFTGAYAAGYYSYKWAEVLSADAFAAFKEADLDDDDQVAELGRRFRNTVLAAGGSRHPMDVFVDFRGREPETVALLQQENMI